jgi:hypothetical protein
MATCPPPASVVAPEPRGTALQQLYFIGGIACKLKARRAVGLEAYHRARREVSKPLATLRNRRPPPLLARSPLLAPATPGPRAHPPTSITTLSRLIYIHTRLHHVAPQAARALPVERRPGDISPELDVASLATLALVATPSRTHPGAEDWDSRQKALAQVTRMLHTL